MKSKKRFIERVHALFSRLSLRNKLLGSMLVAVLFISIGIAFVARWILVSSLTNELEMRGSAIAHSVAERGASYLLDNDVPPLLSLIFDEVRLHERRDLISYIFIENQDGMVLAHTLTRRLPDSLRRNRLPADASESIRLLRDDDRWIYDIAVPINEGLYRIGAVHVGLSKDHIDNLVGKLRLTFFGFISGVILVALGISSGMTRHIARPLTRLTGLADEISRGNFDVPLAVNGESDWDTSACPAYTNTDLPCWHLDQSTFSGEVRRCAHCAFYHEVKGDELVQLGNSFRNMVWSIRLYRQRLRESEEKYRSLFDSGPEPVLVVDLGSGNIKDANPRAEELYGYAPGEMLGRPFVSLGPQVNAECLQRFQEETVSGCLYYPKLVHYRRDGEPFFVNMHACPIAYRGRAAIIVAAVDITEMMEKDAQLIQASKMKTLGEMSAGMAHELNQPLNAIRMGSEFLSMAEEGVEVAPEQRREVLREIGVQVDRAAEIINTLRAFGRKADLVRERLDLNKPVLAVLSMLRRQFELENVRFDLDLAEGLPPVYAHNNRLQQVFFNLLTNARDALDAMRSEAAKRGVTISPCIRIRTGVSGRQVYAEVEDNGPGIPEMVRAKIFEPFFTTKETGQGMGLGLAITYGIVKDYGGDIHIEGEEGSGTVFRVMFPCAPGEDQE
ncbi:histidine kinase [Paucidesulfovibrio gracilis DSM 16080]|uniref:histidine kinase n=1 Tax=Paucidesulfovibrio gracilis DSM 16080 TaxID=1121449 RepID=A0A1T4WAJ7_9BACT|nr:ATP-binding protein [Paucidesulfovibrio gracilis]SKA74344.1 histidine kinase [Paucidesulfovibrio gracilis DSM 16080]